MLDSTSRIEFLRTGLARYPNARETVDYFETTLLNAVLAAFKAKIQWKNFQPFRDGEGELEWGKGIGPVDRFIHAFISGALPLRAGDNKVWLSLGVYWNPPRRTNAPVVAACQCWMSQQKGGVLSFVDIPNRDERVVLAPLYKKGERRLLLEPDDDFDPVEDFALLLDSADSALGGADSAEPPVGLS